MNKYQEALDTLQELVDKENKNISVTCNVCGEVRNINTDECPNCGVEEPDWSVSDE